MGEGANTLRVKMLGGFHMYWGNREIRIKSGPTTKTARILQLLLYSAPAIVPANTIIRQIFSDKKLLDPDANLKTSVTLLRRQLSACGLPRMKYISARDLGYIWTEELPPELDTRLFENAVKKALASRNENAIKACMNALSLYGGRFLPELEGNPWVEERNAYFSELYCQVLQRFVSLMNEVGRQEGLLPYLERACMLQPRMEWEIQRIRCLMDLSRWDEAKAVYIKAVNSLARDQDIRPPEELTALYKTLSVHLTTRNCNFQSLREIVDNVREPRAFDGAYSCSFLGFVDAARTSLRTGSRVDELNVLILCSLVDLNGEAIHDSGVQEEAAEKLSFVLSRTLSYTDFFARYNLSQFLIFLSGVELEEFSLVEKRIERNFRYQAVRGVRLMFEEYTAGLPELEAFYAGQSPSGAG